MSQNGIIVWAERVPSRLSWDEWTSRVHNVGMLKKKIAWYIGDLLNYGLDTFGERAWQEIEAMGYSEGALSNFKYVAKKFPPEERSGDLPWSTYQAIAGFRKPEREKLVTRALKGELNRADIRRLAAETNGNGALADSDGSPRLLNAKEEAFHNLGLTMAEVGRMYKWPKVTDETWAEALDELIAKAMIVRGMLK